MTKSAVAKGNIRLMDKVVNEALSDHRTLYREWLADHVVRLSSKELEFEKISSSNNRLAAVAKS
jgi:hypothetical protein